MTLPRDKEDRDFQSFCEPSPGEVARKVCIVSDETSGSSGIKGANDYTGPLSNLEEYNATIEDNNNPNEVTVYCTNFGVEQFHLTGLPDQLGNITWLKLGPNKELSEIRYNLSVVTTADLTDKLVAVVHALGNEARNTTFNLIDGSGNFQLVNNAVLLNNQLGIGTYNFTIEATDGTITLSELITLDVLA